MSHVVHTRGGATINPDPTTLVCTLSSEERSTRGGEVAELFRAITQARELPDGFAYAFPPDPRTAHQLLDFVLSERACCAFYTFEITFPAPHDAIWLTLRGGEEIKEITRASFQSMIA